MPATLRPRSIDVTDRYPMLAFILQSPEGPRTAEVVLATELALFTRTDGRNSGNFYSSREHGVLTIPVSGSVYTVPPAVMARFIHAERLYYALATASSPSGQDWRVDVMPGEASPFISLRGLTDRALRRVRMFPTAVRTSTGVPPVTRWAGDLVPAAAPAQSPAPAPSPAAAKQPAAPVPYNDGFGPLPPLHPEPAPVTAAPPAPAPAPSPAPAPVTAASLSARAFGEDGGIEGPVMDEPETGRSAGLAVTSPLTVPDYPGARLMPSPAFNSRKGHAIDRIVIHITSAPQSRWLGSHFTRPDANSSAHYMIDQNGAIIQFVREQDRAWHAGGANSRSIGIEHVAIQHGGQRYGNKVFPYTPPTDVELTTSAQLVAHLCRKYGLTPDRTTIVGHREADPKTTHTDCPDGAWDWADYMARVATAYAATPAGGVPGATPVAQGLGEDEEVDPESRGIEEGTYDPGFAAATASGLALGAADYDRVGRTVPSPAFTAGRGGATVDRIVIHITDAPTTSSTVNSFSAPDARASAHYLVGQDGEIVQFVSEGDTAWHAKGMNRRSIGIEHVAIKAGGADYPRRGGGMQHYDALPPSDIQYSESAALVSHLCQKYGLTPDRTTIIGHNEADPKTSHTACPVGNWDWDHFMGLIRNQVSAPQGMAFALGRPATARAMVAGADDYQKIRDKHAADWRDLFQWRAPAAIKALVEARGFHIQLIEDAVGDLNLDFYKVRITRFPQGLDGPTLLAKFIRDITSFLDKDICTFKPYDSSDAAKIASADPVGACFNLDINAGAWAIDPRGWDDAAIVISDKGPHGQPTQFYSVTTIHTPDTGDHPVSGHRQFGYYTEDGATYFYTRGADRATLGFPGTEGQIFSGGEKLWQSFQKVVANFITAQGGEASIVPPYSERFNASAIKTSFGWGEPSASAQSLAFAMDAGTVSVAADRQPVTPPSTETYATLRSIAIQGLLAANPLFAPMVIAIRAGVEASGLSVGIGPHVNAGLVGGAGLGAGLIFAPGNVMGAYGGVDISAGWVASIGAQVQLTIIKGGVDAFGGVTSFAGLSGGEEFTAGACALFNAANEFIGVQVQGGIGVGSPIEIFTGVQKAISGQLGLTATPIRPTRARALDAEDWTINWDEVEQIAQPTDMGCWATSAAMISGWRDMASVDPTLVARFNGYESSLQSGLSARDTASFIPQIGFEFAPAACYTPEGFRDLLERYGPLFIVGRVPGLHAIVVTGMYRKDGQYYVRITDPWDRIVGDPGAPGAYADTHSTGSRYIMGYDAFAGEYEAASGFGESQIAHAQGTTSRQPNRGSATGAGYAFSLADTPTAPDAPPRLVLQPLPAPGGAVSRTTFSESGRRYDLAQLAGMVSPPNALAGGAGLPPTAGPRVLLDEWPYIEEMGARTQANVVIDWMFDGAAVGDIMIAPAGGSVANGRTVSVRADILPGGGTDNRTVMLVRVVTTFSKPGEADQSATTEVTLSGGGSSTISHAAEEETPPPAPALTPQAPVSSDLVTA